MNSNGTFSVGKTWKLTELRAVEVVNVSSCPPCLPFANPNKAPGVQHHFGKDVQMANRKLERTTRFSSRPR